MRVSGGNYADGRSDQMCISSLDHPMPACLLIHGKSPVESAIVGDDRGRSIEVTISDQVDIQFIGIDGDE